MKLKEKWSRLSEKNKLAVTKLKEKWSQLSKKNKLAVNTVGLVCVVAIISGGSAYANNQSQQKIAVETPQALDLMTTKLSDLNKKIESLLDSQDKNYLAKNITEKQVNKLKKEVDSTIQSVSKDTLSDNEVATYKQATKQINAQLDKVEKALETQTTINSLYQQEKKNVAMNGVDVKKDLPIKDDLKKETVEEAKKKFLEKDTKIPYNKTISDLLTIAENQVKQIEKAKSEVAKVFKNGKIVSTDKKLYEVAKTEVDKIKNKKVKKELSDQLAKVKTEMDKKSKEESNSTEETKQEESKNTDSVSKSAKRKTSSSSEIKKANSSSKPTYDGGSSQGGGSQDSSSSGGSQGGSEGSSSGGGSQGGGSEGSSSGGGSESGESEGGSSGGGSQGGESEGGSSGGESEGGSSGGEGEGDSKLPEGWIIPPYPIGSDELESWLEENGYSGYDVSDDGYIRPY